VGHALNNSTTNFLEKYGGLDEMLLASTGVKSKEVAMELIALCGGACSLNGEDVKNTLQTLVAAMAEIAPKDLVESALATRFWALHTKGMNLLGGNEHNAILALRLLRLSSETLETLLRWRRRGEQRLVVSHVNLEAGAVVGNLVAGSLGVKMVASKELEIGTESIIEVKDGAESYNG